MSEGSETSFIDETHQAFVEFAERFLEEDERDEFVNGLLERHGYEKVEIVSWSPPAPPAGGSGGGRQPLVRPRSGGSGGKGGAGKGYFRGSGK